MQALLIGLIVALVMLLLVLGYGWLFVADRPRRRDGKPSGKGPYHRWDIHADRSRGLR